MRLERGSAQGRTRIIAGVCCERKLVQAFVDGEVAIDPLKPGDLKRVAALMAKYPELGLAGCSSWRWRNDFSSTRSRRPIAATLGRCVPRM